MATSGFGARLEDPPGDWPRTKAVLTQAVKLSKIDRQRFIADACLRKPELQKELLAILESYDKASDACGLSLSDVTTKDIVPPPATPPPSRHDLPVLTPNATYGPYRIVKQLGAGGMGQVFLAVDVRLDRQVAVKSLAGKWLETSSARQRLMREARTAAALTHPHIATLYDVVEDGGHLLLVMEYVEGRSVKALVDEGPVPLGHALRLAIQIADAIGYAHDRGIVHCDIKPGNIQVAVDGGAKVLDFGLARARYDARDEISAAEQGKLLGTLGYMPPERILEGTLNASGDIYGLGVVIFEMTTGRKFFDGRDLSAYLLTVFGSQLPRPSEFVETPAALDEVVALALAKNPMLRYHSARELSRDLQKVLLSVDHPANAVVVSPSPRVAARVEWSRAAVTVAAGTLVVLMLAGFVTSMFFNAAFGISGAFDSESWLAWPYWGLRSMVTPLVWLIAGASAFAVFKGVCAVALRLRTLQPVSRPVSAITDRLTRRLSLSSASALAQVLLVAHAALLTLNFWLFSDFVTALDRLIMAIPQANFAALAPGNVDQQLWYRQILSLELWVFGFAWYRLMKFRRERQERGLDLGIIGGIGLVVFTLVLLALPYRLLRHNEREQVIYGRDTCYVMGQRQVMLGGPVAVGAQEVLLFCPMLDPPRNRVVRADDRQLVLGGPEQNVFSGFTGAR